MKHLFVPYELALKLKEKGFDEICLTWYDEHKTFVEDVVCIKGSVFWNMSDIKEVGAPLYQQVIDWFRENHNRQIEILWRGDVSAFCYKIGTFRYGSHSFSKKDYDDYYECMTDAIEETLKLI